MGASATQTGLGAPEGAEPPSRLGASPAIPSAALLSALQDIRDDIDWACTAIMKLHEQKARHRLEERLIKIDKLIDSIVVAK